MKSLEGPVWVAIGLGICASAYSTGIGTFREPGAGFVAFVAGLFVVAVGSMVIIARKPTPGEVKEEHTPANDSKVPEVAFVQRPAFRMLLTVAILLFYAIFLNPLGYIVTTFIALFALFYDLSTRRWLAPFFASGVSVAVTYLVFEVWLRSQLPRGILPWW